MRVTCQTKQTRHRGRRTCRSESSSSEGNQAMPRIGKQGNARAKQKVQYGSRKTKTNSATKRHYRIGNSSNNGSYPSPYQNRLNLTVTECIRAEKMTKNSSKCRCNSFYFAVLARSGPRKSSRVKPGVTSLAGRSAAAFASGTR